MRMDKKDTKNRSSYTFVDLFAGCGGLSEGFYIENFRALSHVEIDSRACESLKKRMEYYEYDDIDSKVLNVDITKENIINDIELSTKGDSVDLIIGGPPCQSFSTLGRARDKDGMKTDPRNYLFESYVKILNHFLPKIFVFENVLGLLSAKIKGKFIINEILDKLGENYNLLEDPQDMILNSVNYGVPQVRKRLIILGVRKDLKIEARDVYNNIEKTHYDPDMEPSKRGHLKKYVTVHDAIYGMPFLKPGEGKVVVDFQSTNTNEFLKFVTKDNNNKLYQHIARNHNDLDIQRYEAMSKNNWTFEELLYHRVDLRHPKKRVFNNSYVVQSWDLPSKTIIAHLYKDGNQFIHPDPCQSRTLTPREAARLQSFPDNFIFAGPKTEQYKQIGNAVPPLLAKSIAKGVKEILEKYDF